LGSLRRDFAIVLAATGVIVALILLFGPKSKISFLDLRVVNDTHRTVTIQPCWDLDCLDFRGLQPSVIQAGRSVHVTGHYATDVGHEIVVGIRKPGGKPWQFSSCMVTGTAAGQPKDVIRVSKAQPCFTGTQP
jgi:hypothetical protein